MVNPVHQHLDIDICANAEEACTKGYDWAKRVPAVHPIEITKVVIVRDGTQAHKPTGDFVLRDDTGKEFVCIVTGALLQMVNSLKGG